MQYGERNMSVSDLLIENFASIRSCTASAVNTCLQDGRYNFLPLSYAFPVPMHLLSAIITMYNPGTTVMRMTGPVYMQ